MIFFITVPPDIPNIFVKKKLQNEDDLLVSSSKHHVDDKVNTNRSLNGKLGDQITHIDRSLEYECKTLLNFLSNV